MIQFDRHPSSYSCICVNTLKATSDTVTEKLLTILQETGHGSDANGVKTLNGDTDITSEVDMGKKQGSISREPNNLVSGQTMMNSILAGDAPKSSLQKFPINKCQVPGLDYVLLVNGSGPHDIQYSSALNKPVKEVIVSRKCAEAVLRGAQVFVPGVLACSAHVEKGDTVAVSVAVEQPVDGGWSVGITRGITLEGTQTDPHHLQRRGLYIGQGTAVLSRAGIFRALHGVAVEMTDRFPLYVFCLSPSCSVLCRITMEECKTDKRF
ncbi:putative methyltransferase NSUN6 [Papaver somniferum]|uniref:putative methyltransferase NSUN6 n=1 Tax=Papaver somniferum TaxID=3469 RepID=UPI000E6F4BCD|nr:putative methyltransferase NSUN6 [Papaver somniferum]